MGSVQGQSCLTPGAWEEPGRGVKAALAPAMPIPAAGQPEKSPLWAEQREQKGEEPCQDPSQCCGLGRATGP